MHMSASADIEKQLWGLDCAFEALIHVQHWFQLTVWYRTKPINWLQSPAVIQLQVQQTFTDYILNLSFHKS